MISPGESSLLQSVADDLVNYFLNTQTSALAIETTLAILLCIEQEYNQRDVSSVSAMLTSAVSLSYSLWKSHHLEKINIFKEKLNSAKNNHVDNVDKSIIGFLLEFYRKSDDWSIAGYFKSPSINIRLSCELLSQAAGVKSDYGFLLQKYPTIFLAAIESAANKYNMVINNTTVVATNTFAHPAILKESSLVVMRSRQPILYMVELAAVTAQDNASDIIKRSSTPPSMYTLD